MACIHGFAPGDCLICSTLDSDGTSAESGRRVKTKGRRQASATPAAGLPAVASGRHPDKVPRTHSRTLVEVVVVLALIVAAVIAIGLAAEIVRGIIHVLELAVVAVVAAVVGYGAGRAHGGRKRRPPNGGG